ncbi:unnamed protein product [Closterium sp. NIES-53]
MGAEPRRRTEPRRPPSRAAQPSRATQLSRTAEHCPTASTPTAAAAAFATTAAPLATASTAAMASPTVLTFDAEGRAIDFDVWVDDLQLFLQCDSRDGVSLFYHTSGVSTTPTATAESTVRSQWTTRDAVARLAVLSHLPLTKRAHFDQYKTAQSLYDAVVACYSSPTTAALSRLMLQYLFPDFAAACRLDYATSLVAESTSASVCPPSVKGECALGMDVLEDRQEDLECFAAASPHLVSMLLAPEGDPDALDILTPRSYAEAIEGPYSSQRQAAMDAEMASWKSTGTYVDEVPPPGANIVSGMWIFRVKRPPGSPPAFKARYVARGFSQRQGVDFFHTFSPTPKMTTLRHSLPTGQLARGEWLRRPPGLSGSFPPGTQWIFRRPVYGLRQAPREWHDTLRTTLASLGFAPSTADPSLFLRTDTTLPPFYVLEYIDDLAFATADTEALAHVKAQRTITLTQSHMVQQVLQRFGFTYSSPQSTPLPTGHLLSAPPSDESVEPSGPYQELVGCLISSCEAEIYAGAMAAQELRWLTYLLTDLGEAPRSPLDLYVDNKAMLALC